MSDIRSQQRQQQEDLHLLNERMRAERPDYVELIYGTPLDTITIGFPANDIVVIHGTPDIAASLVSMAGFASYLAATRAFASRDGGETGKMFSADHAIAQLIGYTPPKVADEDRPWHDF